MDGECISLIGRLPVDSFALLVRAMRGSKRLLPCGKHIIMLLEWVENSGVELLKLGDAEVEVVYCVAMYLWVMMEKVPADLVEAIIWKPMIVLEKSLVALQQGSVGDALLGAPGLTPILWKVVLRGKFEAMWWLWIKALMDSVMVSSRVAVHVRWGLEAHEWLEVDDRDVSLIRVASRQTVQVRKEIRLNVRIQQWMDTLIEGNL